MLNYVQEVLLIRTVRIVTGHAPTSDGLQIMFAGEFIRIVVARQAQGVGVHLQQVCLLGSVGVVTTRAALFP
jgi:hypothetical protein